MKYEDPVFRPPCEAGSLIFQVTVGCPHNQCLFCGMYKMKRFRVRDQDELKAEVRQARLIYNHVESIFLADGNTIAMNAARLADLIAYIRQLFPEAKRVSCYAGARFLKGKSHAALRNLAEAGLDIVYLGLESGDDKVLARMRKGVDAEGMVEAARRVKDAGIEFSTYILMGLGGEDGWESHARETARVLNRMNPTFIRPRTLALLPGMPLYDEMQRGLFQEASGQTVMREMRLLVSELDVADSFFMSDHISNYVPVYGRLPQDRDEMLVRIDKALAQPEVFLKARHLTHL